MPIQGSIVKWSQAFVAYWIFVWHILSNQPANSIMAIIGSIVKWSDTIFGSWIFLLRAIDDEIVDIKPLPKFYYLTV